MVVRSANSMSSKNKTPCPICAKPTSYFEEPVGPFCSTRCQMVDLGKWLNEDYRISEPLKPHHLEEFDLSDESSPQRSDLN